MRPCSAACSTTGSKAAQLYGPLRVGWIAAQSIGQRIVSIPPAFMYLTSFSVSVVCGTIPKKPFGVAVGRGGGGGGRRPLREEISAASEGDEDKCCCEQAPQRSWEG